MSFWNYLGGVALFNMICDWFSGKPKSHHQSYTLLHDHVSDAEYETRLRNCSGKSSIPKRRLPNISESLTAKARMVLITQMSMNWMTSMMT